MAATIKTANQAFTEFARRNALTSTQRAKLRTRRDRVARYLREDGWIVTTAKFGGSHARRTKARLPMDARSDVDVYVVLDRRHKAEYGSGWGQQPPKQLLTDIKASLDKKLDTPAVRADSPSVRITYADMLVDVVPAFSRLFGGSYDIPYYDRWMTATPDAQRAAFTQLNSTCGGLAIDLVRMLKHWKAQHPSFGLRSYHLEVLAYDALKSERPADLRTGMAELFRGCAWRADYSWNDPGGSGTSVTAYASADRRAAAKKMLQRAADRADQALDASTWKAEIDIWRSPSLFGSTRFPAYTG